MRDRDIVAPGHVNTLPSGNLADLFTKPRAAATFKKHVECTMHTKGTTQGAPAVRGGGAAIRQLRGHRTSKLSNHILKSHTHMMQLRNIAGT